MAKNWYPVIDYSFCIECGTCVSKCTHGAYDIAKNPIPVVANPANCIDHCHGCGNICPVGAITYVGDDTGWMPPNGVNEMEGSCCCCNNKEDGAANKVSIEYLYLDMNTCERCIGTDLILESVLETLTPALELAGYKTELKKIEIATPELAAQYQFISSPTIRVNEKDIFKVEENHCDCCSDISSSQVDCRVFSYNGEIYEQPPKEMLAEAILKTIFGLQRIKSSEKGYELPENLRKFFDGKKNSKCSCGGNC